jgi:hypothetical protein
VPGKPWPAEKSSGGDLNRQREETPGAKPRDPYGGNVPAAARRHFRMANRKVSGGANRRRGSRVERQGRSLTSEALKGGTP